MWNKCESLGAIGTTNVMIRSRVLLADDHRMVAEGLKNILMKEFDLVGVVEDGLALITAAKALQPDVIVADISMPRLNGLAALEELKKQRVRSKVVFLTMHHNVTYARRALDAGASGFVLKHSAAARRTADSCRSYTTRVIENSPKARPSSSSS